MDSIRNETNPYFSETDRKDEQASTVKSIDDCLQTMQEVMDALRLHRDAIKAATDAESFTKAAYAYNKDRVIWDHQEQRDYRLVFDADMVTSEAFVWSGR